MTHYLNWKKIFNSAIYILMAATSNSEAYKENDTQDNDEQSYKKILLWTPPGCVDWCAFTIFKSGDLVFKKQNCAYQNCYVVPNKEPLALIQNASDYDAIIFNGELIPSMQPQDLPQRRKPEQIYIFMQLESFVRSPVYKKRFDDFFNWTVTYRFDSDIPWPYFLIKNMNNETIGPNTSMEWETEELPVPEDVKRIVEGKSKFAAWFVSNCEDRSGRLKFVNNLNKEFLSEYNETVDIYGRCGPLKCPKKDREKCNNALKTDYLFYMAMENSFAEDYVTEKVFTALDNYNIPVVFGGADYSRFLPPGSFIEAHELGPERLADVMNELMMNRTKAAEYFRWRNHYTYQDNIYWLRGCACDMCAKLNQRRETRRYVKFRHWWNRFHK